MSTRFAQTGLTLVELVVTIVILAIALVAVTQMMGTGLSRSSDTLLELRTATLAKAYIDEILGKRFDEKSANNGVPPCRAPDGPGGVPATQECTVFASFGPDGGEVRDEFDDVDDYDDIDEGEGGLNPDLEDIDGNTRTGYDRFRVVVDVRYIDVADEESALNQNNELDDEYDAKVITVTVSHALLRTPFVYTAYKSNF
jgi:MSHA pilin protein MshD